MKVDIIAYLLKHRHFPLEDQELISQAFTLKKYKTGEYLIKAGNVARQLFFISQGILKITIPHPESKDIVYFFMKENQFMTFLYSMYENSPCMEGLAAASYVEVYCISDVNLLKLYGSLPYLRALIDGIAQRSMADMVSNKNRYAVGDAAARYDSFLKNEPSIVKMVSLTDIASFLGITQQSLSRVRKAKLKFSHDH